jgi:hypothetical protein
VSRDTVFAVTLGVGIGVIYTLSPLLVVFVLLLIPLLSWAVHDIPEPERRRLLIVLALAVVVRVLAVGALFLWTDHFSRPYGSFFGDEEYFIKRSWWLRNVALGIPISTADMMYAYDYYGQTSYLYLLAFLHTVFGPSPYGLHLFSIFVYLCGALFLYRMVRRSFGAPASLLGLGVLLFLPSLFAWSVSALKEPVYFGLMAALVAMAVGAVRAQTWLGRLARAAIVVVAAFALNTIREGSLAMAIVGTLGGLTLGTLLRTPRLAATLLLVAVVAVPPVLTLGRVQDRIVEGIRAAAVQHWGHINTVGYVYTVLDGRFYLHRSSVNTMTFREGGMFVVRALASYVTVPTPWQLQSRAALPFLPEQMIWYALVVLAPFGLVVGLRRDRLLSCVLLMNSLVAAGAVALISGNVGTLVRHRALALPFLVWFSALGICDLAGRIRKDAHADYR